jgi:hypothetical protein
MAVNDENIEFPPFEPAIIVVLPPAPPLPTVTVAAPDTGKLEL